MCKPIYYIYLQNNENESMEEKKERFKKMGFRVVLIREGKNINGETIHDGLVDIIQSHC